MRPFQPCLAGMLAACLAWSGRGAADDPEPTEPPAAVANGFDDLKLAVGMLKGIAPDTNAYPSMGGDRLRALVAPNRPALRVARRGLSRPARVPPDARDEPGWPALTPRLVQMFNADAALAEEEGRADDATRAYLDLLEVVAIATRGGRLDEVNAGARPGALAIQGIARTRARLGVEGLREAVARLEAIDRRREPLDAVLEREAAARRARRPGLGDRVRTALRVPGPGSIPGPDDLFPAARGLARDRLMTLDLATRVYRLERKGWPDDLSDLTPGILESLPVDPFDPAGGPLRARIGPRGPLIYSIGPDRSDDGGRPIAGPEGPDSRGDLAP